MIHWRNSQPDHDSHWEFIMLLDNDSLGSNNYHPRFWERGRMGWRDGGTEGGTSGPCYSQCMGAWSAAEQLLCIRYTINSYIVILSIIYIGVVDSIQACCSNCFIQDLQKKRIHWSLDLKGRPTQTLTHLTLELRSYVNLIQGVSPDKIRVENIFNNLFRSRDST